MAETTPSLSDMWEPPQSVEQQHQTTLDVAANTNGNTVKQLERGRNNSNPKQYVGTTPKRRTCTSNPSSRGDKHKRKNRKATGTSQKQLQAKTISRHHHKAYNKEHTTLETYNPPQNRNPTRCLPASSCLAFLSFFLNSVPKRCLLPRGNLPIDATIVG